MRHKFLVLTVKKWLESVYIYGSYREIKTGVSLFWTTLYSTKENRRQKMESIYWRRFLCHGYKQQTLFRVFSEPVLV